MIRFAVLSFLAVITSFSCNQRTSQTASPDINQLADRYVRLGLDIGQYDASFVDAYYGPDSLKPTAAKKSVFPKDSFLLQVQQLQDELSRLVNTGSDSIVGLRSAWMKAQLTAFGRRIKIFAGELASFDEESRELYGTVAPAYPESHYQALVAQLNALLPGNGNINDRYQLLADRFVIPKNKLDTVFRVAINECRKRTLEHYNLPPGENFTLEFVTNQPWSGYNWYKGNYQSLIQINTDLPILIDRAIDVGSHESYPGHHVYNVLLEKNLYRDRGWVEVSLYPLFSPQSLIAEGSANYGIDMVFPGNVAKAAFCKSVLLPLAGVDTTGITTYFEAGAIKGALNFARNEAGRGLLNQTMDSLTVMRWLKDYCLMNEEGAKKSISFIKANRSYVINYNHGLALVKNYMTSQDGTEPGTVKRWELFGRLLSNPMLPAALENPGNP